MRSGVRILFFLLFSLCAITLSAQVVLMPLQTNPLLENINKGPRKQFQQGPPHVQKLPFFDDFSNYDGLYPNDTMWLDNYTYISKTMSDSAPSVGVVVFEGLNAAGRPYRGIEDQSSYPSDTLTSTYIDLSPYTASDSLYLSFFYQPGGLGDAPEKGDSLVVQFHPDSVFINNKWDSNAWIPVWGIPGFTSKTFGKAMLPIKAISGRNYFHGKFQFRIIAYSSQSGNLDHWLVDYIYLNQGRTQSDKTFEDVAIFKNSGSILNTYYSMPVKQALAMSSPLSSSIPVYGSNNSSKKKNVAFGYEISNAETGSILSSNFNTQGDNLNPGEHRKFIMSNFLSKDSIYGKHMKLLVKTTVKNIPDEFPINDTATHVQEFGDYLAYDDGTAENSFGVMNVSLAKVAVRYILPAPDTLYGVAIHFTFGTKDVSKKTVTLAVWDHLTDIGKPENDQPVRRINYVFPQYTNKINGYYYFKLPEPLAVKDQFYVGWIQNSDFMLNVGADFNYADLNSGSINSNLLVSLAGHWESTNLTFAPMIRPYLGTDFVAGMPVLNEAPKLQVKVYPNPTEGILHIETDPGLVLSVTLFSLDGRQLSQPTKYQGSTTLSYPNLRPGMYLLQLRTDEGMVQYEKVIVH